MKRIIVLLLALILLLPSITVFANNNTPPKKPTVEETVRMANEQLGFNYYDVSKVNKDVYEKYGALVYGSPYGDKDKNGQSRYLGKTPDGTEYTNYKRLHDDWAGGVLDTRNWIKEPWMQSSIPATTRNPWNGTPEWNDAIIEGMKAAYGKVTKYS